MEVLVVGNTAYVDDDFCAKAFPGDHVKVVAAQDARRDESSGSVEKVGVAPDPKRVGPASWNLEHG